MDVESMRRCMDVESMRMTEDRVLIKPIDESDMTPGGIALPSVARQRSPQGIVCAVGPGLMLSNGERVPLSVNVGDKVVFSLFSGTEFKIGDVEYRILRGTDEILAVLED
jgi:chaperonin GroES